MNQMQMRLCVRQLFSVVWIGLSLSQAASAKKLTLSEAPGVKVLEVKEINRLKKESCVFFHVWATWCSTCMEEMPDLIRALKGQSTAKPIVIDTSEPSVQESFSKKWIQNLRPGFSTYVKPNLPDEEFMKTFSATWNKTLPLSALFHRGKLLEIWVGSTNLGTLNELFQSRCRDK